jgi:release factor glutamine methyltransferase
VRVGEWIEAGEQRLTRAAHPERARRDAETLVLARLGRDRAYLLTHGEDELRAADAAACEAMLARRVAGEPIQYILGEAEFYGLAFRVTPAVLIPRPETEHLVEKALSLVAKNAVLRIADIGTGSGAIAVTLAAELPQAQLTAVDLSLAALAVAQENAALNGVAGRIRFFAGDLLAPVAGERFDLIASNPPYIPEEDRATLAVEVRAHEPELALFAGADGLAVYRRLIPAAFAALEPGGWLLLEIGYGQSEAMAALLSAHGFAAVGFTADLQGIPRVAAGQRPRD